MLEGAQSSDTLICTRYFELAVNLAVQDSILVPIASAAIEHVLNQQFFVSDDILFQLSLMDFVVKIGHKEWSSHILGKNNFLPKMLDKAATEGDTYGFLSHTMIQAAACIYSKDP